MHIRTIAFWSFLSLGVLGVAACGGDDDDGEGLPACPDGGTELTYDNFGQEFFSNHCTDCHSAGSGQAGAEDEPLDSQSAIQAAAEDVYKRAVTATSMPPNGGPTAEERQKLGEWLSCGAK